MEFCCICANILTPDFSPEPAEKEKHTHLPDNRTLECCSRIICGKCLQTNQRFELYCPYCQISTVPTSLPQRLKDPPSYTSVPSTHFTTTASSGAPPPYTPETVTERAGCDGEKRTTVSDQEKEAADDTLHFLDHEHDTIASLSLRYRVPADALRRANNVTSDHLLLGRRTVVIPGEYYKSGISLSPRPIEGEEEELRRAKIRRFMTSCKVSDYDVALLYIEQSNYDLGLAVEQYFDDEAWERENPTAKTGRNNIPYSDRPKKLALFRRNP